MCQCNGNNRIKRRTSLSWNGRSILFHPSSQLCHRVWKDRRLINAADLHSLPSRFALTRFSRRTGAGGRSNPLRAPNISHHAACCVWPSLVWRKRTFVSAPRTSAGMSLQPPRRIGPLELPRPLEGAWTGSGFSLDRSRVQEFKGGWLCGKNASELGLCSLRKKDDTHSFVCDCCSVNATAGTEALIFFNPGSTRALTLRCSDVSFEALRTALRSSTQFWGILLVAKQNHNSCRFALKSTEEDGGENAGTDCEPSKQLHTLALKLLQRQFNHKRAAFSH